jgi:hypothetical protein
MTTEYQRTREEDVFERLLDEKWGELSEEAHSIVRTAYVEAYKYNLVRSYSYQPFEYFMGMEDMVRLSGELGDHEREILLEVGRAAAAAAAVIDPEDKRPAGYRGYGWNVHHYYKMMSGMIEEALQPKTNAEREEARVGLWRDYANFEKQIEPDSRLSRERLAQRRLAGLEPEDLADCPF